MRMRLVSVVLTCVVGSAQVAAADEPSKAPEPAATNPAPSSAPTANPAAAATPAASAPAASSAAAASDDRIEKHFRAEGYTVKTVNGEKQYCKKEDVTGSRLGGSVKCTPEQILMMREREAQENVDRAQRVIIHPQGN
jgi:hypothetical protein